MAKQTFTTGQVLTAAQMTALQLNDYNQTVSAKVASYTLVASDAGTRITMSNASATTITVNTSLFAAGDTLFITNIGAGVSTITAGTATVSTASSLALAQYDSGTLYFTSTGVAIWQKYQGASSGGTSPVLTKAVMGADFTTSSTSYVDITGMTITRTPVSATNNIQIIATMNITPTADRITRFRLVYGATNSNIIGEYLQAKAGYNSTLTIVFNVTNVAASSTVFKMQMLTDGSTTVNGNNSGYLNSFSVLEVY
jgi:hypothetical protein